MQNHYTYLLILGAALAGPFALSFDKKVAFYKKLKYVIPAMIFPAIFYIIWDSYFTGLGVWRFNRQYILGISSAGLPVEEILFFFVVPYCCVFIYECIKVYFPRINDTMAAHVFFRLLAAVLLMMGAIFYDRLYTASTFIFFALFVFLYYGLKRYLPGLKLSVFLLSYAVILVPFLLVNGLLTAIPVVIYNDAENLGLRVYTIPFEDIFYGMLLVFMNVVFFEKLRS